MEQTMMNAKASHALTMSQAQHAAIEFAKCVPLSEIQTVCLDALQVAVAAELQDRDKFHGRYTWDYQYCPF